MTDFENEAQRAYTLLGRLEMVSHGTVMRIAGEPTGRSERVMPPGGLGRRDHREAIYERSVLKTHEHFAPLVAACRSQRDYRSVAKLIEQALDAWRLAKHPPRDSQAWRELVGKTPGSVRDVARVWGISPSYAHQLRRQYGEEVAA